VPSANANRSTADTTSTARQALGIGLERAADGDCGLTSLDKADRLPVDQQCVVPVGGFPLSSTVWLRFGAWALLGLARGNLCAHGPRMLMEDVLGKGAARATTLAELMRGGPTATFWTPETSARTPGRIRAR